MLNIIITSIITFCIGFFLGRIAHELTNATILVQEAENIQVFPDSLTFKIKGEDYTFYFKGTTWYFPSGERVPYRMRKALNDIYVKGNRIDYKK